MNKKFLQYEKQGTAGGINIGWTNNATAKTAKVRAKWFFTRHSDSNKPLRYGELLAIAWGNTKNRYMEYTTRNVGINLQWSKKPVYQWVILGGQRGTPIRRGKDWVIIYNIKHEEPLIYFNRTKGGHIGWPDSKKWRSERAAKVIADGTKWTVKQLKKELERLTLVCKIDPVCLAKIKSYQAYMIQLRTNVKMYRLPDEYNKLLSKHYPYLKNLNRYRFGYSNRQPANNATTDCSKTYYNDKKFVNRLKQGKLKGSGKDWRWLTHELQHYNQCKEYGGRSYYAKKWFGQLEDSILKGNLNMKEIHDKMPMEKNAFTEGGSVCSKVKHC